METNKVKDSLNLSYETNYVMIVQVNLVTTV